MNQMVEAYIKLAELETKKEVLLIMPFHNISNIWNPNLFLYHYLSMFYPQETNKRMQLPREIRSLKQLELVSYNYWKIIMC